MSRLSGSKDNSKESERYSHAPSPWNSNCMSVCPCISSRLTWQECCFHLIHQYIQIYCWLFKFKKKKRNHWHSFRWKVRNILKSAVSFISSCTVWIPVGRADEKHRENWQGIYKPNVMKDICAYYIIWDDLGCPLYCFSSSLLPPLF